MSGTWFLTIANFVPIRKCHFDWCNDISDMEIMIFYRLLKKGAIAPFYISQNYFRWGQAP